MAASLIAFKKDEKWGYKNNMDKVVIDPVFQHVPEQFKLQTEVLAETDSDENNRYYLFDRSGNRLFCFNELFEEEISGIYRHKETSFFLVDVCDWDSNEFTGMVNEEGKIIIPPIYDTIAEVGEGLFKTYYINPFGKQNDEGEVVKNKFGLYDSAGKEIFSPQFDDIGDFDRRIAIASKGKSEVLINLKGEIIAGTESESIDRVSRMHYILHKMEGDQLFIRPDDFGGIYDTVEFIDAGFVYFVANKDGKYILVDMYMKGVAEYEAIMGDSTYLLAKQAGKWGIITYNNEVVTGFVYDYLDYFNETAYLAGNGGKFGLLDKKGNILEPIGLDSPESLFVKYKTPNRTRNLQ